jgi:transcriptional regulator
MTDHRFAPRSPDDLRRLVLDHPFAWVVSAGEGDFQASALPIRPVFGVDGEIETLIGHFARGNPHAGFVRRHPRALVLFVGPHGYVSPSWLTDRTQAPTWNHASAQFVVDIGLTEEAAELEALLRDLIDAMETDRPNAWRLEDMGPRYERLSRGVIGFRARVQERRSRFKLGQDERPDVFREILQGLSRDGHAELRAWMEAFEATDH